MKRTTILRSVGAAILSLAISASIAQTTSGKAPPPSAGSENLILPPVGAIKYDQRTAKPILIRHPTQAGKVSQTMSGNFVPSAARSWLAKGDKRYSLCATTKRSTVACSPLVAVSVLKDLEVDTIAGKDGVTLLTFKAVPGAKRHGKALAQAAGTLMQRVERMSAHLERRAVSYVPKPWEKMARVDSDQSLVAADDGSCGGYDEFGTYSCEGGGSTQGGEGGGGSCHGQCDYPSGNDNGDPAPAGAFDPTTGEGIDPNAPEVIIVGQRPEQGTEEPPTDWIHFPPPMPDPAIVPTGTNIEPVMYIPAGCIPGPRGTFVCPPAPGNPFGLPKPPPNFERRWTWSNFRWCKIWNNCGPIASEGEPPKAPAITPGEKFLEAMAVCRAEAKAEIEYCVRMRTFYTPDQSAQCEHDALENYKACETTAIDIRDQH